MAMNQSPHGSWLVLAGRRHVRLGARFAGGRRAHRWAMPTPECVRPERCVVIDRTTSTVPLSKGPYTEGGGEGYGLLEQWLARLGCHTVRKEGPEAFTGDVLGSHLPQPLGVR